MIKNYFKLAVRALLKNKIYSLINIFGLAIGIAICLLIVLFIQSELGYDQYHERKDRIYRLAGDRIYPGRVASRSIIPQSIGAAVQRDLPEIEESTRIFPFGENNNTTVKVGAKTFEEKRIVLAIVIFSGSSRAGSWKETHKPHWGYRERSFSAKIRP